jgi:hypothetical protein
MQSIFDLVEIWLHGLGWYPNNLLLAARQPCSALANEETLV